MSQYLHSKEIAHRGARLNFSSSFFKSHLTSLQTSSPRTCCSFAASLSRRSCSLMFAVISFPLMRLGDSPFICLALQFGAAMHISEDRGRCGTICYQPPEIFNPYTPLPCEWLVRAAFHVVLRRSDLRRQMTTETRICGQLVVLPFYFARELRSLPSHIVPASEGCRAIFSVARMLSQRLTLVKTCMNCAKTQKESSSASQRPSHPSTFPMRRIKVRLLT